MSFISGKLISSRLSFFSTIFFLYSSSLLAQDQKPWEQYQWVSPLSLEHIDSLVKQRTVLDEFKIVNYCHCIHYLNVEQEKDRFPKYRKVIDLTSFELLGKSISYFDDKIKVAFFRYQNPDSMNFKYLDSFYYAPIVKYIRSRDQDHHEMDGFSIMFECYHTIENMPVAEELQRFLLLNRYKMSMQVKKNEHENKR